MMKKLSLATQITIIFIAAFILTSLLLGVFITRRLDSLYENTVFEKLEAEGKAIRFAQNRKNYEPAESIAFIKYIKAENTYFASENIMPYIDDEAIGLLLGKAVTQTTNQSRYKNTIDGRQIYYVAFNYQGVLDLSEDVLIVIADSSIKHDMIAATRMQIYFVCVIAFSLGYIIILIWITKFIDDTKKISFGLKKIGENHYKTKVTTKRKDEIGDLVDNIESMRRKIIENEQLRQEIIQGVSHDLKTPIALISSYAEAYEDGMCEADEMVEIAKKETKRLNAKVTKLLNLTRLGYIDTNVSTVGTTDMKSLLDELAGLYSYQNKINIRLDLSDAEFLGDKESWFICAQNILDNALRYAKNEIKIKLEPDRLTIANDGIKIDEKILPKIFNTYEKSADGKFGIGLSIVKRTVEIFGYEAKAENAEGGVRFLIIKKLSN